MNYFGGTGVAGALHPSLRVYIDCFVSPPFPKAFPRGGGVWDQDPILMRDFRTIRELEIQYKNQQDQLRETGIDQAGSEGGSPDLEDMLEQYLDDLGEDGHF